MKKIYRLGPNSGGADNELFLREQQVLSTGSRREIGYQRDLKIALGMS